MTADDEPGWSEIEDLRPVDHWGRRPVAKAMLFGSMAVAATGGRFVDGDGGDLMLGGGGAVVALFGVMSGADLMRGRASPLPGRDMRLLSPVAIMIWGAMFFVVCSLILGTVALDIDDGERPGWLVAFGAVALGLAILGIMVQIGSLSDQWPDKWRPPYARQQSDQVEERPAGGSESAEPSRSDERP